MITGGLISTKEYEDFIKLYDEAGLGSRSPKKNSLCSRAAK